LTSGALLGMQVLHRKWENCLRQVFELQAGDAESTKLGFKTRPLCGRLHKCLPSNDPALESIEIVDG
jgi:hypothetical protein